MFFLHSLKKQVDVLVKKLEREKELLATPKLTQDILVAVYQGTGPLVGAGDHRRPHGLLRGVLWRESVVLQGTQFHMDLPDVFLFIPLTHDREGPIRLDGE
jgi:hypothetical protein